MSGHRITGRNMKTKLILAAIGAMPLQALAASPIPYDQWSVANGIITANCLAGIRCGQPMSAPGMLQREISLNSDGSKFIQNILTDTSATGNAATLAFSNESFVRMGWARQSNVNGDNQTISDPAQEGIAIKQTIGPDPLNPGFRLSTIINRGWADDAASPSVLIQQQEDNTIVGAQVASTFSYRANTNEAGVRTGFALDNDQQFINGRNFDPLRAAEPHASDVTRFSRRTRSGDLNPGGTNAGTPGSTAQVTWVGTYYSEEEPGKGIASFGFQSYDVLNDTRPGSFNAERDGAPGRPWSWNTVFGPMPTMPFAPRNGD